MCVDQNRTYVNDVNRHSGFGAVGLGFLNGSMDDEDEDAKPPQSRAMPGAAISKQAPASIPLAAPRPGYPAPVAALKIPSSSPDPSPRAQPPQQMSQVPQALRVARPQFDTGAPRMPPPIYQTPSIPTPVVPSTPHPLQPPMTPITPVFVRPSKSPAPVTDVKFAAEVIMRGNSEDNLLPKRGERGDHFWRRFSIVAKEEKKPSSWLVKTQSGMSRMSRWVWLVAILILAGIGLIAWYEITHKSSSSSQPTAVGGKANETAGPTTMPASAQAAISTSTSLHVSPTNTVARRVARAEPTPLDIVYVHHGHSLDVLDELVQVPTPRRSRKYQHRQPRH
ncbi:hypothetical protein ID866_8712 [Astraeus odoratus]|nr:hypothetical protein ID866_8712 [Astraeus odoratus]